MDERIRTDRIERIVSSPRFARYQQATLDDLEAVVLYLHNVQIAEALFPLIAMLEVSLRNAVHLTLSASSGSPFWFDAVLHPQMNDNIHRLIETLSRRTGQPAASATAPAPAPRPHRDVVATDGSASLC